MTNLDQSQLDFCQSDAQNIRLLAPAGCGKTSSLLYRCRELAERAEQKPRFLIVTFTKAATAELKDRLINDPDFKSVRDISTITTLNAYGYRRIRESDQVRSPQLITSSSTKYFAMMNQLRPVWLTNQYIRPVIETRRDGAKRLMEVMDNIKSLGFDHTRDFNRDLYEKRMMDLLEQGLLWRIRQQFEILTEIGVLDSPKIDDPDFYIRFYTFWLDATHSLLEQAVFTFEDQKYWTYIDMKSPGIDGKSKRPISGAARYHHVIVDEFQDINPLDLALIKTIADRNQATLTIVGDDDQAIFEWRGATPEYILHPDQYFGKQFKDYILEVNYRSPKNIVDLSQRLISNNENRVHKKVHATEGASTAKIEIKTTSDIHERLKFVTDIVKNTEPGKVAVIGRLRRQLIPHQIYFVSGSDSVPFKTATDLDILSSQAFDDFIKLLEIWDRAHDRRRPTQVIEDVIEICNFLKKYPLSKRDKSNLQVHLQSFKPRKTSEAVLKIREYDGTKLSGKTHEQMYEEASEFVNAEELPQAIICINDNFDGLSFDPERAEEEIFYTAPPLEQLAQIAESEGFDIDDLIERVDTAKAQIEEYRNFEDNSDSGDKLGMMQRPLHLMTATRSKGKEFDTVVILDAVDEFWPYKRTGDQRELESERRLFYVAFTRARKRVVFLTEEDFPLSPFVKELGLEEDTE